MKRSGIWEGIDGENESAFRTGHVYLGSIRLSFAKDSVRLFKLQKRQGLDWLPNFDIESNILRAASRELKDELNGSL